MERTKDLADLFGVVHAFDDLGFFVIQPSHIGFGIIGAPLAGGDEATAQKLGMLMQTQWPADTLMQISFSASPDVAKVMRSYADTRRDIKDPLLREFSQDRLNFLEAGTKAPIDTTGMLLREMQLIISVSIPFKGVTPDEAMINQVMDYRVAFEQALTAAGMSYKRLTPSHYIRFVQSILNHDHDASWRRSAVAEYDPTRLVCQQILDEGNKITVEEDGIWLGNQHRVTVLSPKKMPKKVGFGMAMRYLTDWKKGNRGIPNNALITLNCIFPNREKKRGEIERKRLWATHSADGKIARFIKTYGLLKTNMDLLADSLDDGDGCVMAYLSMSLITPGEGSDPVQKKRTKEKALTSATNAIGYWQELGFTMMRDKFRVRDLFFGQFPFAADTDIAPSLERYRTMAGKHAVALMPIMGSWRGTGTPLLTLNARDGQLMPISPRDTNTGQNFLVAGGTGAGKSFAMSDLISNVLAMGGRVNVIEIGNSYKNICHVLDGQHITFDKDTVMSLNPFTLISDYEEESEMLAETVQIMASPKSGFSDYEMAGVKRIMSEVFSIYKTTMTIDALEAGLLNSGDPHLVAIGRQLFDYTSRGSHGKYFNSPNTMKIESNFTVLELEDLRGKPSLQRVVLMMLMYQIERSIYLGDREQYNLLLIDEAWSLLAQDDTAKFVSGAYRKYRKYKASVGIITQSISDVWDTAGGRAIVDNSQTTFLLRQKADSIEAIRDAKRLPFGDWGYDLLKSLTSVKGQYSEILVASELGTGVGRLVVSDFYRKLYSTTPDDVVAIRRLRSQGHTMVSAIRELIRHENSNVRAA